MFLPLMRVDWSGAMCWTMHIYPYVGSFPNPKQTLSVYIYKGLTILCLIWSEWENEWPEQDLNPHPLIPLAHKVIMLTISLTPVSWSHCSLLLSFIGFAKTSMPFNGSCWSLLILSWRYVKLCMGSHEWTHCSCIRGSIGVTWVHPF